MLSSATREYLIAVESKTEREETPALPMSLPLKVTPRLYLVWPHQPILLALRSTRHAKVTGHGRDDPGIVRARSYSLDSDRILRSPCEFLNDWIAD
jgi:hypothetical protein